MTREAVMAYLSGMRERSSVADLAFYAYRDLAVTDWRPFISAALQRNPVCAGAVKDWPLERIVQTLESMPNESIYDGTRAAQPDEVWNYGRGDGLERVICLAAILEQRNPGAEIRIEADGAYARLRTAGLVVEWAGAKGLTGEFVRPR